MKAGDLVAYKLEVKDRKRSNVRYRNPLGLGLIVKPDPTGGMYFVRWGQRSGWHRPETLEMVNESR
jgi:hypothetical protein